MRALLTALALILAAAPAAAQSCRADTGATETMLSAVNALRGNAGPLEPSEPLMQAAAAHACDMARSGSFDHRGSDGSDVMARIRRTGCHPAIAAENIAWGLTDPGRVLAEWRGSPGHRRNLLLRRATQAGVARAEGGGRVYWVMVLATGC